MARYTLAVDRRFRRDSDQQTADFIGCVAFGKSGEFAEKYLRKGTKIVVTGRIQTGSYTNSEAKKVYVSEIVVERQEFLEKKIRNSQPEANAAANNSGNAFMDIPDGIDEELPFN